MLASFFVVAALVVAIADGGTIPLSAQARSAFLIAMGLGAAAVAAAIAYRSMRRRAGPERGDAEETAELRKNLLTAEAIIKAEPQVLVFWEQGQGVRVMAHTLGSIAGLPQQHAELLKFGKWLDLASAQELKNGLDALFSDGRPFTSLLKTAAGGHVEADGRAAGGRAILRLRDIAGRKRDLARILDQHRQLVRDTLAGRTLLNALPMPAWFRDSGGRIQWVNEAYAKAVEASSESEVRERQIELLEMRQREAAGSAWPRAYPTASACTSSAAGRARRTTSSSSRSRAPASGRPSTWPHWRRRRASWCGTWRPTSARSTGWPPPLPSSAPING